MKTLLKAVRNTLIGDATLVNLVGSASDIRSSFAATIADYPIVGLSVSAGTSVVEGSDTTSCILHVGIRSDADKADVHDIYARIKTLLHDQEASVSDAAVTIHLLLESNVDDSQRDMGNDVWLLRAEFVVLFSASGLIVTTATDGQIYAHETDVSVDPDKLIATFSGRISLDITFESKSRAQGERFDKSVYYNSGTALITIESVRFKPSTYDLLWSVTTNESDTLADDSTAATSYTVGQSTVPSYLQFLFRCTQTGIAKALEIEAGRAICPELIVPFSKRDLAVHGVQFLCLGDSSDNIVKVVSEN